MSLGAGGGNVLTRANGGTSRPRLRDKTAASLLATREQYDVCIRKGSIAGQLFAVFNDDDLCLRERRLQALPEVLFDVPWERCLVGIWFLVDDERRIDQHKVGKRTARTLGWTGPGGDREECRVTRYG